MLCAVCVKSLSIVIVLYLPLALPLALPLTHSNSTIDNDVIYGEGDLIIFLPDLFIFFIMVVCVCICYVFQVFAARLSIDLDRSYPKAKQTILRDVCRTDRNYIISLGTG